MSIKLLTKLLILGGLSIVLLIALASVGGLVNEREDRLRNVESDIIQSYAGHQNIIGPIVVLQYAERWVDREYNKEKDLWYDTQRSAVRQHLVFPDSLNYQGDLSVEERSRGIFKTRVYQSAGELSGEITLPTEADLRQVNDSVLEINSASTVLSISDLRGISRVPKPKWDGASLNFEPGTGLKNSPDGIHAPLPFALSASPKTVAFAIPLHIHGTGTFFLSPIATENHFTLNSAWPHPSFTGDFLPTQRRISADGFTAEWHVNGLASNARQTMEQQGSDGHLQKLGVRLIDPINPYPLTDRALKYGFLFIGITFAAFFFYEILRQLRIHPIQYGFVGIAQAVFFLLPLSLSAHLGFGWSYLTATAATVLLISFYLSYALKSRHRGLAFGGLLVGLYAALFGLLQSEDHALVAGSLLLFILLALIMVITRKVDWYQLTEKGPQPPSTPPPPIPPGKNSKVGG